MGDETLYFILTGWRISRRPDKNFCWLVCWYARLLPRNREMVVAQLVDNEAAAQNWVPEAILSYRFPYAVKPNGQFRHKRAYAEVRGYVPQ